MCLRDSKHVAKQWTVYALIGSSATDDVEKNIPEYAMLSLSRIVVANQLLFAYNWMSFQCTCKTNDLTSNQGSEIISHKFLSLHANIEIMSIACPIN